MLYPQANSARSIENLSGVWNFQLVQGELDDTMPKLSAAEMDAIAVPASYNEQKDVIEYRDHCGWAVYQRKISIPQFWQAVINAVLAVG